MPLGVPSVSPILAQVPGISGAQEGSRRTSGVQGAVNDVLSGANQPSGAQPAQASTYQVPDNGAAARQAPAYQSPPGWAQQSVAPIQQQAQGIGQSRPPSYSAMLGIANLETQRPGWNLTSNQLNQQYGSSLASNQLQQQGLGLDRQNLATSRERLGLDREGIGIDRAYINANRGYTGTDYANTTAGVQANLKTQQRGINSDYTSRGSWFAPFHGADLNDAQGQADRSMVDAGLARDRALTGYTRDEGKLGLSDRGIDLSYKDLGTQAQQIELQAKQLGMNADDYYMNLQAGLSALGYEIKGAELEAWIASNPDHQAMYDIIVAGGMLTQSPQFQAWMGTQQANATGNPGY